MFNCNLPPVCNKAAYWWQRQRYIRAEDIEIKRKCQGKEKAARG
jgi:hypothetical protein